MLVALRFLWNYDTQNEIGRYFKIRKSDTISRLIKTWVPRIAETLIKKLPTWEELSNEELIILLSIDGTHCPIEEPRPFSTEWSSWKLGDNAGVMYEVALMVHKPRLAWLYGPIRPGKYNDIATFQKKLKGKMQEHLPDKRILGDAGYEGESSIISHRNPFDPEEIAEWKDRVMARQEKFNKLLKQWECVNKKLWRHGVAAHKDAMEAVASVTQYGLDNRSINLYDPYL
ncbi:unknown protein [Seminavis robusta]|uniref:DDE Tnp4 domain-containing protein n=1 Tax=Seminavis robusta TaxID=568900 RepID=A0A9N8DXM6_9STRA|nr:unknown protein [Seminavis robusta]|eukprot:Sro447_g144980.1 n/a (229) ;mRNA; r:56186-56940